MGKIKSEDIKYKYCWLCQHNAGICPHCGINSCSCGCGKQEEYIYGEYPCQVSGYDIALDLARKSDSISEYPDIEDIDNWIEFIIDKWVHLNDDKKEIRRIFANISLDESSYWKVADAAKRLNYDIISFENLCALVHMEPEYDCKTGKEYSEESELKIINPNSWASLEAFENERIPWGEYIRRYYLQEVK